MPKTGTKSSRTPTARKLKRASTRRAPARGDAVDRAVRQATRQAVLTHKKLGQSIVVWQRGRVMWLKPSEIR